MTHAGSTSPCANTHNKKVALTSTLLEVCPTGADAAYKVAQSEHQQGLVCMVAGVLVMVPDATLVRLIKASPLAVAVWRLGLTACGLLVILLTRYGGSLVAHVLSLGRWGILVGILEGCSNIFFILAVDNSSVANVLLVIATSSFWAALLSRVALGTEIERRTLIAMPVVFFGVAIAVSNEFDGSTFRVGDVYACLVSVLGATRRTIMRFQSGVDMLPAAFCGSVFCSMALALSGVDTSLQHGDLIPLMALGLLIMPVARSLLTKGSRLLPSAESSMIMCLETVLSPLLAAVVVGDALQPRSCIGGVVVVVTLLAHALASHRPR